MTLERCIWPGCTTPPKPCICDEHWKVIPMPLRDAVARAWRGGNGEETPGLRRAILEAHAWIKATFDGGERAGSRRADWDALVASIRARDAARRARRGEPEPPAPTATKATEPERGDAQCDLFTRMET